MRMRGEVGWNSGYVVDVDPLTVSLFVGGPGLMWEAVEPAGGNPDSVWTVGRPAPKDPDFFVTPQPRRSDTKTNILLSNLVKEEHDP